MKATVYKGHHMSFPPTVTPTSEFSYKVTFNHSAVYNLNSNDQYDWNKLIGIKSNFFKPRKNSLMVGWRWNVKKQVLQLTYYYHNSKGKRFFNDDGVFDIKFKDLKIPIFINIIKVDKSSLKLHIHQITSEQGCKIYMCNVKIPKLNRVKKWWLIRHWFGGTSRAPQKITIEFDKRM